jgi:choline kinase
MKKEAIAIILAAGLGTRLKDTVHNSPKCLLNIDKDKKLIEIQLEILNKLGVHNVVVVTGYKGEEIISLLGSQFGPISIQYVSNMNYASTGSAASLLSSFEKWQIFLGPVLLLHADILYGDETLKNFLDNTAPQENCLLIDANFKNITNDEQVVLGKQNKVEAVVKGGTPLNNVAGESLGINFWSKDFMHSYFIFLSEFLIGQKEALNWEQTIEPFLESNRSITLQYKDIDGANWINVNYPNDLETAKQIYERRAKN